MELTSACAHDHGPAFEFEDSLGKVSHDYSGSELNYSGMGALINDAYHRNDDPAGASVLQQVRDGFVMSEECCLVFKS